MKCNDCAHVEMCKWIDEVGGNGCDFEDRSVLDKIREEIEANMESIIGKYDSNTPTRDMPSAKIERNSAREECLQIIDKYRGEGT